MLELAADVHQRGRLDRPAQRVDALQRIAIVEMRHAGAFPERHGRDIRRGIEETGRPAKLRRHHVVHHVVAAPCG